MAQIIPSAFCRVQFKDEEEQARAALLSAPTKDWIQYLLSQAAQKRLNLDFDPVNPSVFLQAEAALKGEISAYQYMLAASDSATELLQSLQSPSTN